jgi:nitrogenase-associated protein
VAHIVFYGKPSCGGNARQRALLAASGHELEVRDLFTHPWSAQTLRPFFGELPPADWFNRAAVKVKSGAVVPEAYDEAGALAALLADPPLIRRPLLDISGLKLAGWDGEMLDALIGLAPRAQPVTEACIHPAGTEAPHKAGGDSFEKAGGACAGAPAAP